MSDLTNHYFPKKKLSRKQYKTAKNPWITPDILADIRNKDKFVCKVPKRKKSKFIKQL